MDRDAIVGARYRILNKLAVGFAAEVYRVEDIHSGRICALKLFRKDAPFPEYPDHLRHIWQSLAPLHIRHLLQPLDSGIENGCYWEAVEYLENQQDLGRLVSEKGPLGPGTALHVLAKIAAALAQIHERNIIHADVKPSNILINLRTGDPTLIDFGLIQPVGEADDVIIVGTYSYLHPYLRSGIPLKQESGATSLRARGTIGPYLDIYSLGVVTLEMLTGERTEPRPLSTDRVASLLLAKNPALRTGSASLVGGLAQLLCRMVGVSASPGDITATEIAATANSLKDALTIEPTVPLERVSPNRTIQATEGSEIAILTDAFLSLRDVADTLAASTAAMVRTSSRLEEVVPTNDDSELLKGMQSAFDRASGRIRLSWRVGMGMTLCAFCLTVAMIVCAIVFGIRSGASAWTLVFGSAGGVSIVGTLLWRPYDRAFRATILAQQIEMIHVQMIATFSGTKDLNRRIEICREAISSLGAVLETHATAGIPRDKIPPKHAPARRSKKAAGGS